MDVSEPARIIPEIKPISVSTKETRGKEEAEKFFLSSLTTVHVKEKDKPLGTTEQVDEPVTESPEEPSAPEETSSQDLQKPLRFLPGVLVGWGGELPPLPDVGGKPVITADDTPKTPAALKIEASNSKSPTAAAPRERFVIKKKEAKPTKAEPEPSSLTDTSAANSSSGKDAAVVTHGVSLSLKDKPPNVSTEAFLESLTTAPSGSETSITASANKGDVCPLSETEKEVSEGDSLQSTPQAPSDNTSSSRPPLSGILKKSSAYSCVDEDKIAVLQKDKANHPLPPRSNPVPVLSSSRSDSVTPFHQGYLQLPQAKNKPEEQNQLAVQSSPSEMDNPAISQLGAVITPTIYPPTEPGPQAAPAQSVYSSAASFPLQQPQVPGSYSCPTGPSLDTFTTELSLDQNHSTSWAQDSTSDALPVLQSQHADSCPAPSDQTASVAKDYKRAEERYSDPWDRPRNADDRDHHRRHSHHRDSHHGKKSRHHDREKKHDRTYDDKHRERSRHHGHSDDRYGEKRKDKHYSDDYGGRHKDKHRHRRDSDYENGRKNSKDGYS